MRAADEKIITGNGTKGGDAGAAAETGAGVTHAAAPRPLRSLDLRPRPPHGSGRGVAEGEWEKASLVAKAEQLIPTRK